MDLSARGSAVVGGATDLHVVSWNVAGWRATLEQIRRFKGGLHSFLRGHHVDILCLQEVKQTSKALEAEGGKLESEMPGYESFWACNEGSAGQSKGLNGVATFAREGIVLRADCEPLCDPQLDGEARCLMTDHGKFVIFNVYAPNDSTAARLPFKLQWLAALRSKMQRERAEGKQVILVGDLNIRLRGCDTYWVSRHVDVGAICALPRRQRDELGPEASKAVETICCEWPSIREALRGKECRQTETCSPTKGRHSKWSVWVPDKSGKLVRLGGLFETEEQAQRAFVADGVGVLADGTVQLGTDAEDAPYSLQGPGVLSVNDLTTCLKCLADVELSPQAGRQLADEFGQPFDAPAARGWLRAMLEEDGMVDSFGELHPNAKDRFSCWNQMYNARFQNIGSRIDYVLVDRVLFDGHARTGLALPNPTTHEPNTAVAAAAAALLGGLSEAAPAQGGGLPQLGEHEYNVHFREGPSTGMLYMPPQLSDHAACSLLLVDCLAPGAGGAVPSRDTATKRCQPHRSAKRITDFFGKRKAAPPAVATPKKKAALGA